MTNWPVKTLGEVCEFQNGYAFRSSEYVKKGHALIRIKNVQQGEILPSEDAFVQIPKDGSLDQFVLKAGDILMSLTGNLGRVGRLKEADLPAALNQRVAKVSIKAKALMLDEFLYRVLDSQWFRDQVELYGRGAAQQNVGTSDISKIEIPVPPLDEQKKIVELLDAATTRVTELTACYEQARTHANNLFTSALRELMNDIDDTTAMTLADVCMVDWGNTNLTKKSYLDNGDYLAVSASGPDGRIGHAEHKAFTPVLSAIGARCGRMFLPAEDFTAIKNTITLTPKSEVANGKYIYFLFEHLSLPIRGAAQPFIAKGDIEKFEVAIPPLYKQEHIVARLDSMRAKTSEMIAAYDAKLTAAKNLRQSILEAAFAGDL